MLSSVLQSGVSKDTALKILSFQRRCINPFCGSSYALHIHHRFFRSEAAAFPVNLNKLIRVYEHFYAPRKLAPWGIHDIQNLAVLCQKCHEGDGVGVHGGNEKLRYYLRNSFTETTRGFNIPFYK